MKSANVVAVAGLLLVSYCTPLSAQDQKEIVFWEARERQAAASAVQVIGLAQSPITAAIMRDWGLRWKVWPEMEFVGDAVPPLNPEWLEAVVDGTPMPNFRGMADDEKRKDQIAIYKVWTEAVVNAFSVPADAFAKSAEENAHVTFAHLWNNPAQYRGKVIPVAGRLARLRKYPATLAAQKQGVDFVYEGWIFGPTKRSHPYWVVFPTVPEGLKEAEEMNRQVTFNGYFLKKMKFPAADGSKMIEAPFLIGPTVTLVKEPVVAASTPISMTVVACVVGVILVVSTALLLLNWYFHRGDVALRSRLAEMQADRASYLLDHEPGPPNGAEGKESAT